MIYLNHIRCRETESMMQFLVTNKIIVGEIFSHWNVNCSSYRCLKIEIKLSCLLSLVMTAVLYDYYASPAAKFYKCCSNSKQTTTYSQLNQLYHNLDIITKIPNSKWWNLKKFECLSFCLMQTEWHFFPLLGITNWLKNIFSL